MKDGETLAEEEARAWEMVRDYMDKPHWWMKRYLTKRERWLVAWFKHKQSVN